MIKNESLYMHSRRFLERVYEEHCELCTKLSADKLWTDIGHLSEAEEKLERSWENFYELFNELKHYYKE